MIFPNDNLLGRFLPGRRIQCKDKIRHLVIVVRADPIICGHSTEARNLAEAAIASGMESAHIVSYPIETLKESGLPLKPLYTVQSYSPGISVHRPEPIGSYKVLDGKLLHGMSGLIVDLINQCDGGVALMDLYLVPHGQVVINAARSFMHCPQQPELITIAEAVGSDITDVVNNALQEGHFGAAQMVLSNFLDHDLPVAVSEYTRQEIIRAGRAIDEKMHTAFASLLEERVQISYPAIDAQEYTTLAEKPERVEAALQKRGLEFDGYLLFLSRVVRAKGVDDLIHAYRESHLYGKKKLVICGTGPARDDMMHLAEGDPNILFFDDIGDEEKGLLMHACSAYVFPSKPMTEFTETFGIAVVEKMLAGGPGPVITTETGGIPEATGGNCLTHEAGNVHDLCQQLNRLAEMPDQEKQQLNQAAQDYAMQFDRQQILSRLLKKITSPAAADPVTVA